MCGLSPREDEMVGGRLEYGVPFGTAEGEMVTSPLSRWLVTRVQWRRAWSSGAYELGHPPCLERWLGPLWGHGDLQ